jgi:hypothetical protein
MRLEIVLPSYLVFDLFQPDEVFDVHGASCI